MEIENTDDSGVFRNDERFDFDLLVDLKEENLEDVYSDSCVSTTVIVTTQRPDGWCETLLVSGRGTTIYGFGGRYRIQSETINNKPVWKLDGQDKWLHMSRDGMWGFFFAKDNVDMRVIWKTFGGKDCPANDPGLWEYWTGSVVAPDPDFSIEGKSLLKGIIAYRMYSLGGV